jgi:putative oxidoreductase
MTNFFDKNGDYFYVAFRVIIGLLFLLHGIAKIGSADVKSLIGLAMIIELVAGAFLILGLFTRTMAVISALQMAYAFLFVHVANGGWNPLANKGESALLYFVAFLAIAAFGARRCALDRRLRRR